MILLSSGQSGDLFLSDVMASCLIVVSQCYQCTYIEVNKTAKAGSVIETCMDDVTNDNRVSKVACNTNCFVSHVTSSK